jgi:hypothetical protein
MSIEAFRKLADTLRALPANPAFGLREYTVELNVKNYNERIAGRGDVIKNLTVPITVANGAPPQVQFPSNMEVALGLTGLGLAVVGPFTPQYSTDGGATLGGVSRSILDGTAEKTGAIVRLLIKGPNFPTGCWHRIHKLQVDAPLAVLLICIQSEPLR